MVITLISFGFFVDIDECALAAVTGLQACQKGAECKNTPGSFACSCPVGYVRALNGKDCIGKVHLRFDMKAVFVVRMLGSPSL